MNIQLKQRLVGAMVLVALAVIFIPMLLSGKGDPGSGIDGSNIPSEPDFRFPPVPAAPGAPPVAVAPVVPLGDDDEAEPSVAPDKPAPTEKMASQFPTSPPVKNTVKVPVPPPAKPALSPAIKVVPDRVRSAESGQVNGWVVQVGSFSARSNARALRDKLRKQGHASFVESVKGASGRVYRVRVGPELSKAAADKLRQRLVKESGLKGLVQAYP